MTSLDTTVGDRVVVLFARDHWSVGRIARTLDVSHAAVEGELAARGGPDWYRNPARLKAEFRRIAGPPVPRPNPALWPEAIPSSEARVIRIRLADLVPSKENIRDDLGDLDELAASLATTGQVQPLVVTSVPAPGHGVTSERPEAGPAAAHEGLADELANASGGVDVIDSRATFADQRADLERRGYREVPSTIVTGHEEVSVGDRVHNRGEQYVKAYWHGTGEVVAIFERPDSSWARKYGMPDVEILAQRDRDPEGICPCPWTNYGTCVPERSLSWCVLADNHEGKCSQVVPA